MTCEIKRFGVQEPKGWDGCHHHPILQENDANCIETPYYDSDEDIGSDVDCEKSADYQDTDSDYQSSDESVTIQRIQIRRKPNTITYKHILTDETDFIPE
jgi:hypothetical protein